MLDQFRLCQRESFSILEQMASTLQAGDTEKDIAHQLVLRFKEAGVHSFFHLPVVLFGARTALPGDWNVGNFFPRSNALAAGDSVIMDAAPLFDGYLVDTSYSFSFGENPGHRKMMTDLAEFRSEICDAVNDEQSFKAVADTVNDKLKSMGYEPVHTKHPGEVLGHRAVKTPNLPFAWRLKGFDALSLGWFIGKEKLAESGIGRQSPLWNSNKASEHPPHDGLWLVEPHAGLGNVGAKWEEILVIQDGKAQWLDDNPPHVQQWANIAANKSYAPQQWQENNYSNSRSSA